MTRISRARAAIPTVVGIAAIVTLLIAWYLHDPDASRRGRAGHDEPFDTSGSTRPANDKSRLRVAVAIEGGPVAAWELSVRNGETRRLRTGARPCTVEFADLAPGRWTCALRAGNHTGSRARVELDAGADSAVDLSLRAFGGIAGRVTHEGKPIGDVAVAVALSPDAIQYLTTRDRDRFASLSLSVTTDPDGRYAIPELPSFEGFKVLVAHYAFLPIERSVDVAPGRVTDVDFQLARGAHFAGTLLDMNGAAVADATVNILAQAGPLHARGWKIRAKCRTDLQGRFSTPALELDSRYQLKAWFERQGVDQIAQTLTQTPASGDTLDVGVLAPQATFVEFTLPQSHVGTGMTLSVVGLGQGLGHAISLAKLEFDSRGSFRLAGLPRGPVSYRAIDADWRSRGAGDFILGGERMTVPVELSSQSATADVARHGLTVRCAADATILVILDGDIAAFRSAGSGSEIREFTLSLPSGRYSVAAARGDLSETRDISVPGTPRVELMPRENGTTLRAHVLRAGAPLRDAKLYVRGFRASSRGERVYWARTDDLGNAELSGLPAHIDAVELAVVHEGGGRSFSIQRNQFGNAELELNAPAER